MAGKNKEAVQFLLQRRIKVDQKDRVSLEKPSIYSISWNSNESQQDALFCWQFGMASIHLAAWFGSLEILKLLVQAGAEQKVENEVKAAKFVQIKLM